MPPEPTGVAEPVAGSAAGYVTYYTDPLCCWSWGFEPQWRRLRFAFAGRLAWRYRMGGMIRSWDDYSDPLNSVHRPAQMVPLWLQAGEATGMPIEPGIWIEDPPASSWPACLAFKAAELQSAEAGDAYLRRLREAVMMGGQNVERRAVLLALARDLEQEGADAFDAARFEADLDGPASRRAFQDDQKESRFRGIGRFPALAVRSPGAPETVLMGWRPYEALEAELSRLVADLGPARLPADPAEYEAYWKRLTRRELDEVEFARAG